MEQCAIVGGGLAGFTAYVTLRSGGLEPAEIAVFGTDEDPAGAWRRRAASIRQSRMRSESDGHCYPSSFPGLAPREAWRTRRPGPLVRTLVDRYNPSVEDFLAHVGELRTRSGWEESFNRARIDLIRPVPGGFELGGRGTFRHVLVAPGHPGLAYPEELAGDPRAVHAYEPHDHGPGRVAVVGAGMAAAHEWLNALAAGASVVSVRRREPDRRPLNVPRAMFTRRGLAGYQRMPPNERVECLRSWLAPSYPPGRAWDAPIARAAAEGRFEVAGRVNGADRIVCATGFLRGYRHNRLLARLVDENGLETHESWIALDENCAVPALTDTSRTFALAGVPAQWAFPAADTIAGAKYAGRRFLRAVRACPTR
jgi:hypothetical protein